MTAYMKNHPLYTTTMRFKHRTHGAIMTDMWGAAQRVIEAASDDLRPALVAFYSAGITAMFEDLKAKGLVEIMSPRKQTLTFRVVHAIPNLDMSRFGKVFVVIDGKLCSVWIGDEGSHDLRHATAREFADHYDASREIFEIPDGALV